MARPAEKQSMSYEDYVRTEAESPFKREWLNGEVFAMAGGTTEHGALAMAMGWALGNAIAQRPCRVFSSDVRVKVLATGLSTYPDASVVCGSLETAPNDEHAVTNPILLLEVLSDSTEAYDRGEKFAHYRRIPSLREYVVVSQRERHIEVHRRNEAGRWELFETGPDGSVELASLGCTLRIDDVYRNPLAAESA